MMDTSERKQLSDPEDETTRDNISGSPGSNIILNPEGATGHNMTERDEVGNPQGALSSVSNNVPEGATGNNMTERDKVGNPQGARSPVSNNGPNPEGATGNDQSSGTSDIGSHREVVNRNRSQSSEDMSWTLKLLKCVLRMCLFSPLKWKDRACWISVPHILWSSIHVAKLVVLTKLTFDIGNCRGRISTIIDNRHITMHNLLLEHWDASFETLPYPPAQGRFAVYTIDDLRSGINYTVTQFYNAEVEATGRFNRTPEDTITMNFVYFDLIKDQKGATNISKFVKRTRSIKPSLGLTNHTNEEGNTIYEYNVTKDLIAEKLQTVLKRIYEVNLCFSLHAVRANQDENDAACHVIRGNVSFYDHDQDGQVVVDLTTRAAQINCVKLGLSVKDYRPCDVVSKSLERAVMGLAIVTCIVDPIIFIAGIIVLFVTWIYLEEYNYRTIFEPLDPEESNLPCGEYIQCIQWWNLISMIGDIFTICAISLVKNEEENEKYESLLKEWDSSVVYLGYGCLITWLSCLRFLRINHKFSLLFKTVRRSAMDVLIFLLCVTLIFVGFWACTYVVLGPYHIKFQSTSAASETLFSIINGDEIFATFAILQDTYSGDSTKIWWFSRIIIYSFVSLFTVLVFNLLIAMFNNAYEAVKETYKLEKETAPLVSALHKYLNYKRNNGNRIAFHNLMRTDALDASLHKTEKEMRRVLSQHLMLQESNGHSEQIAPRERTLNFFLCHDFERGGREDDCPRRCCWCDCFCTCTRTILNYCFVRLFSKCWCRYRAQRATANVEDVALSINSHEPTQSN